MVADRPYICELSKNAYGKIMLRGAKRTCDVSALPGGHGVRK